MAKIDDSAILRPAGRVDLNRVKLSAQEGFVLSQIDGTTTIEQLVAICGLGPEKTAEIVAKLMEMGLVTDSNGAQAAKKQAPPAPAAPKAGQKVEGEGSFDFDENSDDDKQLSAQEKKNIESHLKFAADNLYFDLLGLKRGAKDIEVKRAFFKVSKEFHPDRYFSRDIGPYRDKLHLIFKKISEAYEILKDPESRGAYEESLGEMSEVIRQVSEQAADAANAQQESPAPTDTAEQRQEEFEEQVSKSVGSRGLRSPKVDQVMQRIFKARQFHAAGKQDMANKKFASAASNFKLAIAFDPFNSGYKADYDIAREQAKKIEGESFLKKAQWYEEVGDLEEAVLAVKEAIARAPGEARFLHKMAHLLLRARQQKKLALKLARRAVALDAKNAEYMRTLADAYLSVGMKLNAIRELEKLLASDKKNAELKKEIKALKRSAK